MVTETYLHILDQNQLINYSQAVMAFLASKYVQVKDIRAQFLWGWQVIQNCFFLSLLIFSLSIFGHPSLHLHISEVCGNGITRQGAIIIPALVWAQEQHTDLPCGVCFSPQFKSFGMPCWHQQLLCLLAPLCPLFPRHPCGWTHRAGSSAIKLLSWLLLEALLRGGETHLPKR